MSDPLAHVRLGDPDPTIAEAPTSPGACDAVAPPDASNSGLPYLCTRERGHPAPAFHVAGDGVSVVAVWWSDDAEDVGG